MLYVCSRAILSDSGGIGGQLKDIDMLRFDGEYMLVIYRSSAEK